MGIFDCHVHTNFSTDSNMRIEDAFKRTEKQDLGFIINEHINGTVTNS